MTLLVLEKTDAAHRHQLFTILGVDIVITSRAWIVIPLFAIAGIVISFIFAPTDSFIAEILVGIVYGLLIFVTNVCHGLGHIISSRMVNAPMKMLVLTATVPLTLYDDTGDLPSRVHVGRSLGGPALNLIVGVLALVVNGAGLNSHFILFFGIANLVFAVLSSMPVPSFDGSVFLRELRDWKQ